MDDDGPRRSARRAGRDRGQEQRDDDRATGGAPEETAASFRDGWFLTGDVARRDRGRLRHDRRPQVRGLHQERRLQDLRPRDRGRAAAPPGRAGRRRRRRAGPRLGPAHRGRRRPRAHSAGALGVGSSRGARHFLCPSLADYKRPRDVRVVAELPATPSAKSRSTASFRPSNTARSFQPSRLNGAGAKRAEGNQARGRGRIWPSRGPVRRRRRLPAANEATVCKRPHAPSRLISARRRADPAGDTKRRRIMNSAMRIGSGLALAALVSLSAAGQDRGAVTAPARRGRPGRATAGWGSSARLPALPARARPLGPAEDDDRPVPGSREADAPVAAGHDPGGPSDSADRRLRRATRPVQGRSGLSEGAGGPPGDRRGSRQDQGLHRGPAVRLHRSCASTAASAAPRLRPERLSSNLVGAGRCRPLDHLRRRLRRCRRTSFPWGPRRG